MDIERLIKNIIPPNDYQHREGFNNHPLIDKLNDNEKKIVEKVLINMLSTQSDDMLIVETLAYLKSNEALPLLYNILTSSSDMIAKIILAESIFEISQDTTMINIAIKSFTQINDDKNPYYIYKISSAFYYLAKFNDPMINKLIEGYINNEEYLISYNAKEALKKMNK